MLQDLNDLIEVDKHSMYIVQKILKKRTITRGTSTRIQYLVKWKNNDPEEHTWEPQQHIAIVPKMIELFQKKLAQKKQNQSSKQANKNRLWGNDSEQNVSQNQERYGRENGYKLRKQQSAVSRNSQSAQLIKQVKQDVPLKRQIQKQSKQTPRKTRKNQSNSELNWKDKNYIQIDDKQDIKPHKDQETKHKREKQTKPFPQKDNSDKKQKSHKVLYGEVVNHIYRDGQLYYEVEILSKNQKVIKIQQLSKEEVERLCMQGAYQYLNKLLVSMEQART